MPQFTEDFNTAGDYTLTNTQISSGFLSLNATGESSGTGNAKKNANINSGGTVGSVTLTKTDTTFNVQKVDNGDFLTPSATITTLSRISKATLTSDGNSSWTYQMSRDKRNYYTVTLGVEFNFDTAGAPDFTDSGQSADSTFKSLRYRVVIP